MGDDRGVAQQFSDLLHGCGFLPSSDPKITIEVEPGLKITPAGQIQSIANWGGVTITKNAERIWFDYESWKIELDLQAFTLKCSGPDREITEDINFRELFLLSPLLFLMHRLGYFELHAAACIFDQRGYLLLGPSGSGKTTAVLSLMALGAKYLSDDAVVISRSSRTDLEVRALRRFFSVKSEDFRWLSELENVDTVPVPGTNKHRIEPRHIWPEKYAPVVRPDFMIACKVAGQETTEIAPMSKAEALGHLIGSTPWITFDQDTARDQLETYRSLTEHCRTFELKAGRDVFRNPDRLGSVLAAKALEWV